MAVSMAGLIIALFALLTMVSAIDWATVDLSNASLSDIADAYYNAVNSTDSAVTTASDSKGNPCGYEYYPVIHYGPVPAPTTCFNQGPGQLHAWTSILIVAMCYHIAGDTFDSCGSGNTWTGYWNPLGDLSGQKALSRAGGWFSEYPTYAMLQIGVTPGRSNALTLQPAECIRSFGTVIDNCNTLGLDGKQGGQLMLGNDAFWGSDTLYYTFDPNYRGTPQNQYFTHVDKTFDLTKKAVDMALHECRSSC